MTTSPLVTIYIPTYNRLPLLKRAIASIKEQSYRNLEIIIVDDCSTDDTPQYLSALAIEDPRFKYFIKNKNGGACESRNIAINNAQGVYITGLDDDDIFLNNRIQSFIDATLKYDMNHTVLFSAPKFFKKKIKTINKLKFKLYKKTVKQKDLLMQNYIGNQIFVKTVLLQEIKGFDTSFQMWQDLECWYRLLENCIAQCVPIYSYIVDTEHDFVRISNQNKLSETHHLFCKKHKLLPSENKFLALHFLNYTSLTPNIKLVLKRAFLSKDIRDISYSIKCIKRFLLGRYRKHDKK